MKRIIIGHATAAALAGLAVEVVSTNGSTVVFQAEDGGPRFLSTLPDAIINNKEQMEKHVAGEVSSRLGKRVKYDPDKKGFYTNEETPRQVHWHRQLARFMVGAPKRTEAVAAAEEEGDPYPAAYEKPRKKS